MNLYRTNSFPIEHLPFSIEILIFIRKIERFTICYNFWGGPELGPKARKRRGLRYVFMTQALDPK